MSNLKKPYTFNDELIRLLEKHKMRPVELAQKLKVKPFMIYTLKGKRQGLGEELFIKILRKGFGYSEKEAMQIFTVAALRRYF